MSRELELPQLIPFSVDLLEPYLERCWDEIRRLGQVTATFATAPVTTTDNSVPSFDGTTGDLQDQAAVFIDDSGNVGIGTDSPAETLTVGDGTNEAHITSTGDLYFAGTGGLPYGGISVVQNAAETVISAAGTAVQVTTFDANDPSNQCTPDHTNDHITISKAGDYFIAASATVNSVGGAGSRFEMTVQKNNGAANVDPLHVDRNMAGGGSSAGSVSMTGIATLAASDTIEVWIENETGTQNYIVEDVALSLIQVGG